jgi:hypothetical protein
MNGWTNESRNESWDLVYISLSISLSKDEMDICCHGDTLSKSNSESGTNLKNREPDKSDGISR